MLLVHWTTTYMRLCSDEPDLGITRVLPPHIAVFILPHLPERCERLSFGWDELSRIIADRTLILVVENRVLCATCFADQIVVLSVEAYP